MIQPNLSQRWAETSELLGRISSSDLDPQLCEVLLCLVLFCSSVYVHMYVSVFIFLCSVLLVGGRPFFLTTVCLCHVLWLVCELAVKNSSSKPLQS